MELERGIKIVTIAFAETVIESTVEPSRIDEQLEFYREPEVMEKDEDIELPRY